MKRLSEILHEETSDQFLAKMMASWEKAKAKLKSMGFERAPIGPKTHQVIIGKSKIEDLYGIPMRAGHWADVFFATMYDTKAPWCVIDRDGRECYANLDDAMKALQKRMRTIKEEAYTNYGDFAKQHKKMYPSHTEEQTKAAWEKYKKMTYTAQVRQTNKDDRTNRAAAWGKVFSNLRKEEVESDEEEVDLNGAALSQLEDICEMADDLYETLSEVEDIDAETRDSISQIYTALDDLYEAVDNKYDVEIEGDIYESIAEEKLNKGDSVRIVDKPKYLWDKQFWGKSGYIKNISGKDILVSFPNGQTIIVDPKDMLLNIDEEIDMNRFKILANTGLVAQDEASRLVLAFKALEAGKTLSPSQKDIITSTFQTLVGIVTGDTSILTKVKSALPKN